MNCPACKRDQDEVLNTRVRDGYIRRYRRCLLCQHRWATREIPEDVIVHAQNQVPELKEILAEQKK